MFNKMNRYGQNTCLWENYNIADFNGTLMTKFTTDFLPVAFTLTEN